jgi:hypothetical protein
VTVSWDGKVWKMTVNGREFKAVKNPAFIMPPANVKFHVGGYNILTNNVFEGTIRGVRVYNKALSLNEIHTLLVKEIKAQEQGK